VQELVVRCVSLGPFHGFFLSWGHLQGSCRPGCQGVSVL
jgi:hypothetical protein